ncbi:hypothetical protein AB0E01_43455 [Nocardia vinacea]|uniref:hypothetical protein n=1 Tax=Nocardia vinacea TaxID=96468 RepID=UPI0033E6F027
MSTQKTLEQLEWGKKKGQVIGINGAHARKDGSGSHCKFDLYLDDTRTSVRDLTGDGNETWVDVVEMDGNYGCTELQKTAAAIVDVYRSAK